MATLEISDREDDKIAGRSLETETARIGRSSLPVILCPLRTWRRSIVFPAAVVVVVVVVVIDVVVELYW